MTQAPVLLHIGYHKTATSALQQQLFTAPDSPFCSPENEPKYIFTNKVVLPQPMTFEAKSLRSDYDEFLTISKNNNKIPVFSHERLSGYPASGGFDSTLIADRLHRAFPDAYVLVVFREQLSSIQSMYSQYITDGGHRSLKKYLAQIEPNLRRAPSFSVEFYRYHRLFQYYQNLFGKERVLGLTYEHFMSEPNSFVQQLCNFVGVIDRHRDFSKTNTKRSESFQLLQRFVNHNFSDNQLSPGALLRIPGFGRKFGKLNRPIGKLFPKKLDVMLRDRSSKLIRERFGCAFEESNAKLKELSGLDLGRYGYQLPKE